MSRPLPGILRVCIREGLVPPEDATEGVVVGVKFEEEMHWSKASYTPHYVEESGRSEAQKWIRNLCARFDKASVSKCLGMKPDKIQEVLDMSIPEPHQSDLLQQDSRMTPNIGPKHCITRTVTKSSCSCRSCALAVLAHLAPQHLSPRHIGELGQEPVIWDHALHYLIRNPHSDIAATVVYKGKSAKVEQKVHVFSGKKLAAAKKAAQRLVGKKKKLQVPSMPSTLACENMEATWTLELDANAKQTADIFVEISLTPLESFY